MCIDARAETRTCRRTRAQTHTRAVAHRHRYLSLFITHVTTHCTMLHYVAPHCTILHHSAMHTRRGQPSVACSRPGMQPLDQIPISVAYDCRKAVLALLLTSSFESQKYLVRLNIFRGRVFPVHFDSSKNIFHLSFRISGGVRTPESCLGGS